MSIENPQEQNQSEKWGTAEADILKMLATAGPEWEEALHASTIENVSLPVPGSNLCIVEVDGPKGHTFFQVDLDTGLASVWETVDR